MMVFIMIVVACNRDVDIRDGNCASANQVEVK